MESQQKSSECSAECPAKIENGSKCLNKIGNVFNELDAIFNKKLELVAQHGGGDAMQLYVYKEWNNELRKINSNAIEVVCDLELECSNRIKIMQRNFDKSVEKFDRVDKLENDKRNLLEIIRRAREHGKWNMNDLKFYYTSFADIFGEKQDNKEHEKSISVSVKITSTNCQVENLQVSDLITQMDLKNKEIKDLTRQLKENMQMSRVEDNETTLGSLIEMDEIHKEEALLLSEMRYLNNEQNLQLVEQVKEIDELKKDISFLKQQLSNLKSTNDSGVLVSEINDHYDKIQRLKNDLKSKDEIIRQLHATITYKTEVVADLRKEIKTLNQLVSMITPPITPDLVETASSNLPRTQQNDTQSISNASEFSTASEGSICTEFRILSENNDRSPLLTEIQKVSELNELENEYVKILKSEWDQMNKQVKLLEQAKRLQDATLNELQSKQDEGLSECNILKNDLKNNELKMNAMKREIMHLLAENPISFVPQEVMHDEMKNEDSNIEIDNFEDECILIKALKDSFKGCQDKLKSTKKENDDYLNVIIKLKNDLSKIKIQNQELTIKLERHEPRLFIMLDKQTYTDSDDLNCQTKNLHQKLQSKSVFLEEALNELYKEIAFLIGKDVLSDSSMSSFSEMDITPLTSLLGDLKKEIETKDSVLKAKNLTIEQLEEKIDEKNKELYEYRKRNESVESDNASNYKNLHLQIENLRNSLDYHDKTIHALNNKKSDLEQELHDMKYTLSDYKDSLNSIYEEKNKLEEETKNQLITISNLRSALEDTKRTNTAVSSTNTTSANCTTTNNINSSQSGSFLSSFWRNVHGE